MLGEMGMIGRGGNRQHSADRLDPMDLTVIVDESDHRLNGRSSSAWAKHADALRRISFACRSSRFSRSRALSFAAMSVVRPGFRPPSTSAFFTHSFSVCVVQPIFPAIDLIAAQREGYSPSWSSNIRTARARTSGENLFVVLLVMAPPSCLMGGCVTCKIELSKRVQIPPDDAEERAEIFLVAMGCS